MSPLPTKPLRRGDKVPADWLNQLAKQVQTSIRGGKGINVRTAAGGVVVDDTRERIIPKQEGFPADVFFVNNAGVLRKHKNFYGALVPFARGLQRNSSGLFVQANHNADWAGPAGTVDADLLRLNTNIKVLNAQLLAELGLGATFWINDLILYRTGTSTAPDPNLFKYDDTFTVLWSVTSPTDPTGIHSNGSDLYIKRYIASAASVEKIDAATGAVVWERKVGTSIGNEGLFCSSDGGVVATGTRNNTWDGALGAFATFIKYDSAGTLDWSFDTGASAGATAIEEIAGDFVLCGQRSDAWPSSGGVFATVWYVNSSGVVQWSFDTGQTAFTVSHNNGLIWIGARNSISYTGYISETANVFCLDITGALLATYCSSDSSVGSAASQIYGMLAVDSGAYFIGPQQTPP
jgi:hypothetical protein